MALTYKTTRARIALLTESVKDYTLLGMSPKGVPTEVYLSAILNYIPDVSSVIANYISSEDLTELDAAGSLSNNIAPSQRAVVSYVKTSGGINNAIVGCPGARIISSSASTEELDISINDKDTSLRGILSYEDFNKYRDSTLRLITESEIVPSSDEQYLPYWGGFAGYAQQRQLHQGDIIKFPLNVSGYDLGYYWLLITEPVYRITGASPAQWQVVGRVINSQLDGEKGEIGEKGSVADAKSIKFNNLDGIIISPSGISRSQFNEFRSTPTTEEDVVHIFSVSQEVFAEVSYGDPLCIQFKINESSNCLGYIYYNVINKRDETYPGVQAHGYFLDTHALFSTIDGTVQNVIGDHLFSEKWISIQFDLYQYSTSIDNTNWDDIGTAESIDLSVTEFNTLRLNHHRNDDGIPAYKSVILRYEDNDTEYSDESEFYTGVTDSINKSILLNVRIKSHYKNSTGRYMDAYINFYVRPYGVEDISSGQDNSILRVRFDPIKDEIINFY